MKTIVEGRKKTSIHNNNNNNNNNKTHDTGRSDNECEEMAVCVALLSEREEVDKNYNIELIFDSIRV